MEQDRPKSRKGFAGMDVAKRREIARMGGSAVPDHKRSFSRDRSLAKSAGQKGGQSTPPEKRSFSVNPPLARELGRRGGMARKSNNGACE
jgi:general stress protein YciG